MKKRILACLLTLCLAISLIACDFSPASPEDDTYAYLAIDINPSVELVVLDGRVEGIREANEDAEVLLSGEELEGLSVEGAVEKIVALCEELGYLNDENTDVNVTVIADDDEQATELEEKAARALKKGSSRAIFNSNPRVSDTREVKELKDKNSELYKDLNPAKLRLIKSIMEYDPEMTIEAGSQMSIKELIELLKEYTDEFKGLAGDALKEKFKERKEELKTQKREEIEKIFGEELLDEWKKIEALKELYKKLEENAENVPISDEDVATIASILSIEDTSVLEDNGIVTIKSIEKYLDKKMKANFDEIENEIEAILEKYDEDTYALSEEDLAKIEEILGEASELALLEELEALIDSLEDALDAEKSKIKLDDTQKAQIDGIKGEIDNALEQAKEEFETEFESEMKQAKEHFEQKKADRRK